MPWKDPERNREYQQKRLAARTAAGLCRQCERPVHQYPNGYKTLLCELHLFVARNMKNRLRLLKKARGQCVESGCVKPNKPGFVRCPGHLRVAKVKRVYASIRDHAVSPDRVETAGRVGTGVSRT